MRIRRALPFAFLLALSPLFGCATILNGPNQTIHVETDPPGATVTVGSERHTSPVDLVLKRASKGLAIGALVVPGVMFAVDAASGSIHRLDPPFIAVKLEPAAPPAAPAPTP